MATPRSHYSPEFKSKVALEALKEQQTLAEVGSCYGVHQFVPLDLASARDEGNTHQRQTDEETASYHTFRREAN